MVLVFGSGFVLRSGCLFMVGFWIVLLLLYLGRDLGFCVLKFAF